MKLQFLDRYEKYARYKISLKIHPVGAELFHADGWTDRHDAANSHFSQF
jgi:hypothetical protein